MLQWLIDWLVNKTDFLLESHLTGAIALNPESKLFVDKETTLPMAHHDGVNDDDLSVEVHPAKRLIKRYRNRIGIWSLHNVLVLSRPFQNVFPFTLLVTTVPFEQRFSAKDITEEQKQRGPAGKQLHQNEKHHIPLDPYCTRNQSLRDTGFYSKSDKIVLILLYFIYWSYSAVRGQAL